MNPAAPNLSAPTPAYRIPSVDILRGLVMIVMALDHTREMFHRPAMMADPLDPASTTLAIYFARWITHFCAPVFVFLSGLSAFLSGRKKTDREASLFLLKRGIWLILVEMVVVSLGITFDIFYSGIILQVIWAIGASMVILGLIRLLPRTLILLLGLLLVFGHDIITQFHPPAPGQPADVTTVFFTAFFNSIAIGNTGHSFLVLYAILPWTGIMLLGYWIGAWYTPEYDGAKRRKQLLSAGLGLMALFILLRLINNYGDPQPWANQHSWRSILAFLNTSKYPPSLLYTCMTLGPALVFLSLTESLKSGWTRFATVYGRVPFFYYIIHFYLLHTLLVIVFYATGHGSDEIAGSFMAFRPVDFGYTLLIVCLIWLSVVAALYRPCRWFYHYKKNHDYWWLKYV